MRYTIEIILIILNQDKKEINVFLIKRYEPLSFIYRMYLSREIL